MSSNFVKPGEKITWTNSTGAAVVVDEPVRVGNIGVGVAAVAIANSAAGEVEMSGVRRFAKAAGAIAQGARVYGALGAGTATAATSTPTLGYGFLGFAVLAAASDATTVDVYLEEFAAEGPRYLTDATNSIAVTALDLVGKDLVLVASVAGTGTVTLPAVATVPIGAKFTLKKTGSAGAITIDPNSTEQINGGSTYTALDAQNDMATFLNTGAAWILLQNNIA